MGRHQPQHILIVDDDRGLASMYRTALRFEGFDVAVANDGLAALRHIDAQKPDLIVLDLQLPTLRGEAILRELHSHPEMADIPVIVVTGEEARSTVAQATAILRKPCAPERLIRTIDHHLHHAA